VLLKKTKITPFKELFWKIEIQQRKEMLSINNKIPRIKKSGHLLPVLPLIPQKTTKMEEEKGKFIAFDLKTRVGQPSDATKYKKYFRKFEEGNPQELIDMLRNLEEIWTQNYMTSGTNRASTVRALVRGESTVAFETALQDARTAEEDQISPIIDENVNLSSNAVTETVSPQRALELSDFG
jgi:hypothetical protein